MLVTRLKGKITPKRKLIVDIPADVVPGTVEVILVQEAQVKSSKRITSKAKHPAFGLWAKRADITDSTGFAAELRRKIEQRRD